MQLATLETRSVADAPEVRFCIKVLHAVLVAYQARWYKATQLLTGRLPVSHIS